MTQLPPPGWYPDADPRFQRWWNGQQWTEDRQPLPQPAPVVAQPARTGLSTSALATNALCGGIVGAVVSFATSMSSGGVTPLALLFALAGVGSALGWGIPALIRSKTANPPVGRGRATWGIAVGGTGLVVTILLLAVTSGGSSVYDKAGVEKSIKTEYVRNGEDVKDVACPASPSFREGDSFKCVVRLTSGDNRFVLVEVQDNDGSYVWQEQ